MGRRVIGTASLARQVRHAAKLMGQGVAPPRLEVDAGVIESLGIDRATARRLNAAADAEEQVAIIQPYLVRHRESTNREKAASAMRIAARHVQILREGCESIEGEGIAVPIPPLVDLVNLPHFNDLRFDLDCWSWSFGRLKLRRILHSMKGCRDVSAKLSAKRFVITYRSRGGKGRFLLLDQGTVTPGRVVAIKLAVTEAPTGGRTNRSQCGHEERAHVLPLKPRREPKWLRSGARLLLDALTSG